MTFTADQLALQAHIEAENAKTQEWIDAAPGRLAGIVVSDPAHWAEYDITTVAQYQHHMAAMTHYEAYRDIHGIKPRWIDYSGMTTEEIEGMYRDMVDEHNGEYEREIQAAIDAGAPDRETALRWMSEVDED